MVVGAADGLRAGEDVVSRVAFCRARAAAAGIAVRAGQARLDDRLQACRRKSRWRRCVGAVLCARRVDECPLDVAREVDPRPVLLRADNRSGRR